MKTKLALFMAVAALAVLPILHTEPAPAGESPPGLRAHVAARPEIKVARAVDTVHLLMHRLAPVPDAVFEAPVEPPYVSPDAAFVYSLLLPDAVARPVSYPLRL